MIELISFRMSYRVSMMRIATAQKQNLATLKHYLERNGEIEEDNAHALSINPINFL